MMTTVITLQYDISCNILVHSVLYRDNIIVTKIYLRLSYLYKNFELLIKKVMIPDKQDIDKQKYCKCFLCLTHDA